MKTRILSTARLSFPLASALAALLSAQSATAADGTWLGVSGDWTNPTTWSGGTLADGTGFTANFTGVNIGADRTITLAADRTIGNITFTDATTPSNNLLITGANILTLDVASGAPVIDVTQSGRTLTINSQIAGDDGLQKNGAGALTLSGANTYMGATTISSGALVLGNLNALATTSGITMAGGTRLAPTLTGVVINAPITVGDTGTTVTISAPSVGSQTFTDGVLTLGGAITGAGDVTFNSTQNLNNNNNILLTAKSDYLGSTLMDTTAPTGTGSTSNHQLVVQLGITDALPTTTVLTIDGKGGNGTGRTIELVMNGYNQTLAGLNNVTRASRIQRVVNSDVSAASTLTINGSVDSTYGGVIGVNTATSSMVVANFPGGTNGNNILLTKNGSGTFTLTGANTFTGRTLISGGILSLGNTSALSQSPLDTLNSITGDATNGLRTTVTALTMAGLTGNKNFPDVFTTTSGGYTGLTTLTLSPSSGVTHTYSANIGAGTLNLIKTGAGTQILAAAQTYTGTTTSTAGVLLATQAATLSGYNVPGRVIFNGGTIAVQVGGGAWTTGEVDTLLANATKTSGALGIDTTNGSLTQWTPFTTTNFGGLGLNKLGANNLTINQANTYTGPTTVTAGTLTLSNALALQNSSLDTTGAGTILLSSGPILNLGALSGATGDLASVVSNFNTVTAINLNTPAGVYVTYGGIIADGSAPTTVTKTGAGTQVLTGANSYTGATQINGGVLVFGNKASKSPGSAVTAAAAGIIGLGVHNSTATFHSAIEVGALFNTNTLAGFNLNAASGVAIDTTNTGGSFDQNVALTAAARSLTKVGPGLLTLSTANSYSAGTTLSGGTLRANINGALGSGTVTINNIGLQLQVADTLTIANNITIEALAAGSGTGSQGLIQNTGAGNATLSGGLITINATPSAGGHFAGVSTGSLTVVDSINASVPVVVRAGTVIFSGGGSYSSMSTGQGTVRLGAVNGLSTSASLTMGATGAAIFDLAGNNQTLVGLVKSTSTATVGNSSTTNDSLLTTTGTSIFAGVIQDVVGSGTRKVALTVNGGSLTLSGANTYTGATAVTAGTLVVSGSVGATAVTVSSPATLAGNGNIGGNVTIQSGAKHALAVAATPGAQVTRAITGTLTLNAGNLLDLSAAATPAAGEYVLATATTAITGTPTTINYNGISGTVIVDTVSSPKRLLLTVNASSNYASWANDPTKGNIPGEPATGDFDNDGITNIVEYALGKNPRVSSQPAGVLVANTITYTKGPDAIANDDVSWTIETSETLLAGSWTDAVIQSNTNNDPTISYLFTPSNPVKRFARLKVTQLP